MSDKRNRGLGVPLAVIGGCVAFFALLLVLLSRNRSSDDNPALGFPIVLVVLAVVATVVAVVWRLASRKRSDR